MNLKQLQVRLNNERNSFTVLKEEAADAQRKSNESLKKVRALEAEIASLTVDKIVVSEHALLRFVERVGGYDLNAISEAIAKEIEPMVKSIGSGKFPIANGFRAVVKDKVVVTITGGEDG